MAGTWSKSPESLTQLSSTGMTSLLWAQGETGRKGLSLKLLPGNPRKREDVEPRTSSACPFLPVLPAFLKTPRSRVYFLGGILLMCELSKPWAREGGERAPGTDAGAAGPAGDRVASRRACAVGHCHWCPRAGQRVILRLAPLLPRPRAGHRFIRVPAEQTEGANWVS